MALLWADGFDYVDPNLASSTAAAEIHEAMTHKDALASSYAGKNYATGRSGRGLALSWSIISSPIIRTPRIRDAGVDSDVIIGFAINPGTAFINQGDWVWVNANDDRLAQIRWSTVSDTVLLYIDGAFRAQSSADLIKLNVWQYIEFRIHFHASAGYIIMRINGKEVWNQSGLNTVSTTGQLWDQVSLQPVKLVVTSTSRVLVDDWYVCDSSGDTNNDFLGDVVISTHSPIGDGYLTEWTPLTGTEHYEMVNDVPLSDKPDDSSYSSTSTIGDTEMFTYESLAADTPKQATIYGVHTLPFMRITEPVETKGVDNIARRGGLNDEQPADINNMPYSVADKNYARDDLLYRSQGHIFETEPFNKTRWSIDDVNNTQFGVKHVT